MALKSTVHKATLQISDIDRQLYAEHSLTLARHPSETDERLMMRLLAFALQVPHDTHDGALTFARGLSDSDEPDLWRHDLSGQLMQWVEVGQPDDRRLIKASGRARSVALYTYSASTPIWWAGVRNKLTRLDNLDVWQLSSEQSQALAAMSERSMQLQLTIQDGHVWVSDTRRSVELLPQPLMRSAGHR
jgi:uncharacterized protein YaeQ